MKKRILLSMFLLATLAHAQAEISPSPVKHLYVPIGFDSNDSVEVVVTGNFPNPCYARNTVAVEFKEQQIFIEVTSIRRESKGMCPEMLVPYKEVISLGNLQGGTYGIHVNNKLDEKLIVNEARSNSIDDHIYAAIDQLEKKGPNDYVLHGWRYSNCIELDRVE